MTDYPTNETTIRVFASVRSFMIMVVIAVFVPGNNKVSNRFKYSCELDPEKIINEIDLIEIYPATRPAAELSKLGGLFLACNLILTKLEEILKYTANIVEIVFQILILRSS